MQSFQEIEREFGRLAAALPRLQHHPSAARDVNAEQEASLSGLERVATVVTDKVGTMGFFLIILGWTVVWLGWNLLAPEPLRFDPGAAFVLWLFISNLIQIHLMPLIMVGQNLQARHSELRAAADFDINKKAEAEVGQMLQLLEVQGQLLAKQGELIVQQLHRLDDRPA